MYEKIEWSRNPGEFKEWEFDDQVSKGPMHDAICEILEERINVIFSENGVRPELLTEFDRDGTPKLALCINDDSGGLALAEVDFPLEAILTKFVEEACVESDEAPVALKLVLERAISKLRS